MAELKHYGVPGMKWGVRRHRRKDGSLTNAGKKRLYNELNEAGRDDKARDKFIKKYEPDMRPSINKVSKIAFDMYGDNFDYSKGSAEFQIDKASMEGAKKLLGRYANKPVPKMDSRDKDKTMKAVYSLAQIIDSYGVEEGSNAYANNKKKN